METLFLVIVMILAIAVAFPMGVHYILFCIETWVNFKREIREILKNGN